MRHNPLSVFLSLVFLIIFSNQQVKCSSDELDTFNVTFGEFRKNYPIISPKGNTSIKIVFINTVDDYPLNDAAAKSLASQIKENEIDPSNVVLLSPGDKANQFSTLLFQHLGCSDLVIVRATDKAGSVLSMDYSSITSPGTKMLHLTQEQFDRIKGKRVLLCDDVLSTGGTLKALTNLAHQAEVEQIIGYAVIATEGDQRSDFMGGDLFKVAHLPVFSNAENDVKN